MNNEYESIDSRNNLREFRHYDIEEIFEPLTEEQLKAADKRRKELQEKHKNATMVDIWEGL